MKRTTNLSELARVYLEHKEQIDAGWNALVADAKGLVATLADRVWREGDRASEARAYGLKRSWSLGDDAVTISLRLRWSPAETFELPTLELNDKSWAPDYAEVFDPRLFRDVDLPDVDPAELLKDPVGECARLWALGCEAVEAFLARPAMRERDRVLEFLFRVQDVLGERLKDDIGEDMVALQDERNWPAHVEWQHPTGGDKDGLWWEIVYAPAGSAPAAGYDASRLLLVLWNGQSEADRLKGLTTGDRYREHPVVADWSALVPGIADGGSNAALEEIVSGVMAKIAALDARLDRKGRKKDQ